MRYAVIRSSAASSGISRPMRALPRWRWYPGHVDGCHAVSRSDQRIADQGLGCVGVNNLIGVSVSSGDLCDFGPCWSEVGICPAGLPLTPQAVLLA